MNIDAIKSFLDNLDLTKLFPKVEDMLSKVDVLMRGAVLIAPLVLLVLGVLYCFAAPKEANHSLGYRFFWGMSSVQAWRTMQRIAGIAWGALGLILTVVMLIITGGYGKMETMDVVWSAVRCILWELGLLAVSCVTIDIIMLVLFDSKGELRRQKEKETAK